MTILIDADGCPVVDLTLQTAAKYNVPVLILCDTAHQIQRDGAQTLTFGKGADSVDFALVNRVCAGDLVITQDYGLASMCLARRARVLNQNGTGTRSTATESIGRLPDRMSIVVIQRKTMATEHTRVRWEMFWRSFRAGCG